MTDAHKYHGLPDDGGELDSRWFERLTDFQKAETRRQAEFKRARWPSLADGVYSKRPTYHYPHILPEGHLEKSFYPPIFHGVLEYLKEEEIALHTEALNLRSSQACCFNFLFPLKRNLNRATSIFSDTLPELRRVRSIDFEYTGPSSATEWLGEPRAGKRGLNRTSIDAALWWEDQSENTRLTLVEWKYTEAAFGSCSASKNRRNACHTLRVQDIRPQEDCYLAKGTDDRLSRRYWEHLEQAGILPERFGDNPGCPFQGPFYQLMRQFLLAECCRDNLSRTHGADVKVDVMTIGFRENRDLLQVHPHVSHLGDDVVSAWNSMLVDEATPLSIVFVEDLLEHAPNDEWREYIRGRYGI